MPLARYLERGTLFLPPKDAADSGMGGGKDDAIALLIVPEHDTSDVLEAGTCDRCGDAD